MKYNSEKPRFDNFGQAISYYLRCNPARQKSVNLFEPERGRRNSAQQFSGNHPHDIYAIITISLNAELSHITKFDRNIFEDFYFRRIGAEDIAKNAQISRQAVYQKLAKIKKLIEKRLADKNILPYSANNDCDA